MICGLFGWLCFGCSDGVSGGCVVFTVFDGLGMILFSWWVVMWICCFVSTIALSCVCFVFFLGLWVECFVWVLGFRGCWLVGFVVLGYGDGLSLLRAWVSVGCLKFELLCCG